MNNKSPLRYPGGKTRACKILDEILMNNFNMADFKVVVSPFFGGGSFEFFLQKKYGYSIVANDKFYPLYNFLNQSLKLMLHLYLMLDEVYKLVYVYILLG